MNEDKATRYHRLRRRAGVGALLVTGMAGVGLLATGWAGAIARWSEGVTAALAPDAGTFGLFVAAAVFVATLGGLAELLTIPFDLFSGFLLERRYGLSTERFGTYLIDRAKSAILALVVSCGLGASAVLLQRASPDWWWAMAGAGLGLLSAAVVQLAPVLILPLFDSFVPLARSDLRQRLVDLAGRAGVPVIDAYEWQVSTKTRRANAALAGLGHTRRVLLSDTLLASFSDDEIEVVLAHELGHHARGDVWIGIAVETIWALAACFAADRSFDLAVARGWPGRGEIAGLVVLALVLGGSAVLLAPVANALSRALERRADCFALELSGRADAMVGALRRLGAMNLAEERPSRLVRWLLLSHPPIAERIAACRAHARP